jgi:putative chitinase
LFCLFKEERARGISSSIRTKARVKRLADSFSKEFARRFSFLFPENFMGQDYLTDSQLKAIMPLLSAEKRRRFTPYLNLSMAYFDINTERRVSMYLAQLAHESTDLTRWVENLNYSAARLTQVWRNRFPSIEAAKPFANNPQALANRVYNGRMGNRTGSNDGWNYRGRAPMQATGRDMYEKLTASIGHDFNVDFVKNPDLLLQVQYGFLASAWIFAVEKKCLSLADARDIETCTRRINGGTNGLKDRLQNYRTALAVLPDKFSLKSYDEFQTEMFGDEMIIADAAKADNQSRLAITNQDLINLEIPQNSAAPADVLSQDNPSNNPSENLQFDSPAIIERQEDVLNVPSPAPSEQNYDNGGEFTEGDRPKGQIAENITNVNLPGEKEKSSPPPDFVPENKTVNAPLGARIKEKIDGWFVWLGLATPTAGGALAAVRSYQETGVLNVRGIGSAAFKVFTFTFPYLIYLLVAFIAYQAIKEIFKQISLLLVIWVNGRGDMNNVTVQPAEKSSEQSSIPFWRKILPF